MKKFTVLGVTSSGFNYSFAVAEDQPTINFLVQSLYAEDCQELTVYRGHLHGIEDVLPESPEGFYKRCVAQLGSKAMTRIGEGIQRTISSYVHWYDDHRDEITLFLAGAPKATPTAPPQVSNLRIQTHDWDRDGSPRMNPVVPELRPLIEFKTLDDAGQEHVRMHQDSAGAIHTAPVSERISDINRFELIKSLNEPTVYLEKEPPSTHRHYWMVGRGGTAVGIQIRKDDEVITNRYQTILECLQAFATEHPGETLMIHGDNDIFVWFTLPNNEIFELHDVSQVSIRVCGRPTVRTDIELVNFTKSLNIYQSFAAAHIVRKEWADTQELLERSEKAVLDRDAPLPGIPVMVNKAFALTRLAGGFKMLELKDRTHNPYVVSNVYLINGYGSEAEIIPHGWFNSLLACISSVFTDRDAKLVVYNDKPEGTIIWLEFNEYHQVPEIHYYSSTVTRTETYPILKFVREQELIRRLAILVELIRKKDLK